MGKITPTILLIVISLALSGCIGGGGGGSGGTNVASLSGTEDSFLDFYSSPGSGDDGGDDGSDEGDLGGTDPGPGDLGGGDDDGDSEAEGHHNPEPASLALMGAGLAALLGKKLRRSKMKTKILMMILAAGFIMMSANPAQAYNIDGYLGDWGLNISGAGDWTPNDGIYYTLEDYVGPDGYVGPGYGGQKFDMEAMYTTWDNDNFYVALVTGFPKTGVNSGTAENPEWYSLGDLSIDFGADGNYDYGVELGGHAPDFNGKNNQSAVFATDNSMWFINDSNPYPYQEGNPFWMKRTVDGGPGPADRVGYADFAYISHNDTHWFIEMCMDRDWFGDNWDNIMRLHVTQTCGNDIIEVATPEPVSGLLFGLGAIGALLRFRKKK